MTSGSERGNYTQRSCYSHTRFWVLDCGDWNFIRCTCLGSGLVRRLGPDVNSRTRSAQNRAPLLLVHFRGMCRCGISAEEALSSSNGSTNLSLSVDETHGY
jgi:hypothetical protein